MRRSLKQAATGKQFHKASAVSLAAASVLAIGGTSAFGAFDPSSSRFQIGIVPDPQYYSVVQWKTDSYYNTQMNWFVANQTSRNLAFVIGVGDEVQDGNPFTTVNHQLTTTFSGNITPSGQTQTVSGAPSIDTVDPTNHNFEAEWLRASNAWAILDNANIPNNAIIGNHDYFHWDQKKDPTEYVKWFPGTRNVGKPWYGGYSPIDTTQPSNLQYAGLNTYSYFFAGGYKFLNISIQWEGSNPQIGDLNWAQSIINANPGLPTIISTHEYQNNAGRDAAGTFIWTNLVNKSGNDQIFMVLSGHINGSREQTSTNVGGKPVLEILTDYQDYAFGTSQGYSKTYANGGGFLRTLAFDLNAKTVTAETYSPYIATQGDNPFLTSRSGTGANADAFTMTFDFGARFGPPPFLSGINFYWDPTHTNGQSGGGTGAWDGTTNNWSNGSAGNVPWVNTATTNTAMFGGTPGTVTVAAGGVTGSAVQLKVGGYTFAGGTITLGGFSPTFTATTGAPATIINNVLAGSAGLNIVGGKVTLGGANTFTGGLKVSSGGTVGFGAWNNLGAAGQPVTLDGGTLSYSGSTAITESARTITINANDGTLDVPSGGKIVLTSAARLAGPGDVTKTGPGWLTMYVNNSALTGNTFINGGVIEMGNAGALGSVGAFTVNSGGELAANVTPTITNALTVNTGGTIGADFVNAGTTGTFSGPVIANGNFNVRLGNFWSALSQNVALSGNISGPGTTTIIAGLGQTTSTGKLTVTGANFNYSGGWVVPTGTLVAAATSRNALGTGAVTLSGGKLALQGKMVPGGPAGAIAAQGASGFNQDTIFADTDTAIYPSGDGVNNTLLDGHNSFFETGFTPGEGRPNQFQVLTGGISAAAVTSAVNNTVYASNGQTVNTPFAFQSLTAPNTLVVNHGSTATLGMTTPAAFTNLAVLATSVFGNNDTPNIQINFTDGTSVTTTYKAYDWFINSDSTKLASSVFGSTGIDRYSPDAGKGWDQRAFSMYETDIDLTNIGGVDYSNRIVLGLTFSAAYTDAQGKTAVFAVSGATRGWVAATNQAYANVVNVTGDSGIDVSGALTASLGALSISGKKLSITSADATTNPYTLSFASAAVSGSSTIDVAASTGGGAGKVILGPLSGSGALTKSGAGSLQLAGGAIAGAFAVNAGSVVLPISTGSLAVGGLTIGANSKLDINNNSLVVNYTGTSPAANIRAQLAAGYGPGNWSGTHGITSGAANADPSLHHTLGYAEASDLGLTTFAGQSIPGSAIIIKYTYPGDSNLDGIVDLDNDFSLFVAGYNKQISNPAALTASNLWLNGDYNYDGVIDLDNDFSIFVASYAAFSQNPTQLAQLGAIINSMDLTTAQKNVLLSSVPEPGMIGLAGAGFVLLARRRRMRRD